MATNSKNIGRPRFVKPDSASGETPSPAVVEPDVSEPDKSFSTVEIDAEPAPVTVPEPVAPVAAPPLTPIVAAAAEIAHTFAIPEPVSKEAAASAAALPLKAFEAWSENANAYLDFAKSLGDAKTPADLIALQSKFANERFDTFVRQSGELAKLFQQAAKEAAVTLPKASITVFAA